MSAVLRPLTFETCSSRWKSAVSPQARSYMPRFMAMLGVLTILLALTPYYRSLHPESAHPLALMLILVSGLPVVAREIDAGRMGGGSVDLRYKALEGDARR
mgnify:CR=1 FL=1